MADGVDLIDPNCIKLHADQHEWEMVLRGQPLLADMVHLLAACTGSLTWDALSYLRGLLRICQGQDCFPEMRDIIQPVLHWLQDSLRRKPLDLVSKEAVRVTLFDTLAEQRQG